MNYLWMLDTCMGDKIRVYKSFLQWVVEDSGVKYRFLTEKEARRWASFLGGAF